MFQAFPFQKVRIAGVVANEIGESLKFPTAYVVVTTHRCDSVIEIEGTLAEEKWC